MDYEKVVRNIRHELREYIINNNLKSLVLGVSGGIDSTLVAVLAKPVCDELNIPLIGRSITISTNTEGEKIRAKDIGEAFCADFDEIDLSQLYFSTQEIINNDSKIIIDKETLSGIKIRNGNIKARMRMIYLYNIAQATKGLVLSTDNWTEYLLGFSTLHGDSPYDWGGIQELWKTEVYGITIWLAEREVVEGRIKLILKSVINADATDGLGISNTDLNQILPKWKGSSKDGYRKVDAKLDMYLNSGIFDDNDPVIKRHLKSQFKRDWPIIVKRNQLFF